MEAPNWQKEIESICRANGIQKFMLFGTKGDICVQFGFGHNSYHEIFGHIHLIKIQMEQKYFNDGKSPLKMKARKEKQGSDG